MKKINDKLNTSNDNSSKNSNVNSSQRNSNSSSPKQKRSKFKSKKEGNAGVGNSSSIVSTTLNAILTDTAAINFPNRTGNEYKVGEWLLSTDPTAETTDSRLRYIQPGIMRISYIPTYGVVKDSHSGINAIATKIYTTMRTFQTGSTNYDAADLVGYICAWDQCNAIVAYIKRILRFANTWMMNNTYTPKALIETQGISFEDTVTRLTDYRVRLNRLIFQLNTFYIPNVLPIIERHQQMCENFYMDRAETAKAQFIYFHPEAFLKLSMNTAQPTSLDFTDIPYSSFETQLPTTTVKDLLDYLQSMISELVNNSIVDTMSGDLQRAFGADKQRICYILEADSYGVPVYDEGMLNAVHNIKVIAASLFSRESRKYVVDPNTNMFTFKPVPNNTAQNQFPTEKTLYAVDFDTDTPSALDIIDTARFMTVYDDTNGLLIGSEWFTHVRTITKLPLAQRTDVKQYNMTRVKSLQDGWYKALSMREPTVDVIPAVLDVFTLMPFRKAPIVPYLTLDSTAQLENFFFIGETNNLGTMEISNLFAIEDTVMYVLFGLQ